MSTSEFLPRLEVSDLLARLSDKEESVRIAAARALARVAPLPLEPSARKELGFRLRLFEPRDIGWTSFLPRPEIRKQISVIVHSSDEDDRKLARRVVEQTARVVRNLKIGRAHV